MATVAHPTSAPSHGRTGRADSVQVTGVTKSFGETAVLRGASLAVAAGSVVALLGPSGCGKTTLLRTIAGLERPEAGEIRVGERTMSRPGTFVAPERRGVGMVFQDAALFPHLSVARNVAYGLSRRVPDRSGRVAEALELVGLAGYADRSPATLSGGQMQRVALARALAPRPSVILLDEPFSGLDAPLRAELRMVVRRLLAAIDATAVFVTHDQEEAFVVGDEVAVMDAGLIVQQGPPTSLYELPATRGVARFIGDANLLAGEARGGEADTVIGPVPLHACVNGPCEVMVRPERIVASPGEGATIEGVEYYGHDAVYRVRCDGGCVLRARVIGAPDIAPGARVALSFTGAPTVAYPADAPVPAAV
jgi:iron(III) transport system ATP-binding protein